MNPLGSGALERQLLLQARQIQQMVIGRPLLDIAKDFIGADDLPELQRRVGIARMEVGVGAVDGLTEAPPRCRIFWSPSEIPAANLLWRTRTD